MHSTESIRNKADSFFKNYSNNIDRGNAAIKFTNCLKQWDDSVISKRSAAGKESVTFGLIKKSLNKIKSQYDQLTFSMELNESESLEFSQKEIETHKMLFNHFCFGGNFQHKLSATWKKGIDYGYTFLEVNFERENDKTLNLVPCLRYKSDPSVAFWSGDGEKKTKIDSSWAGYRIYVNNSELRNKLPKNLFDKVKLAGENEVIYFWHRGKDNCKFFCVNGEYKREDLIDWDDEEEVDLIERDDLGVMKFVIDKKDCVYFCLIVNNEYVIKDRKFPNKYIPLPYWFGLTEWTKDDNNKPSYFTQPLSFILEDCQRVHNYAWSQAATILKSVNAPRVLLNPQHVQSQLQRINAENINKTEGALILGTGSTTAGQVNQPMILPTTEIPQSLIALISQSKQEMEEMIGMYVDTESSDTTMVSGVALDKITKNMNISSTNSELIACQIEFINDICLIIKEMIPLICTNRRKVSIQKPDNKNEDIIINDRIPETGKILNDLRKLVDVYTYQIKASPNDEMQVQASLQAMTAYYGLPQDNPDVMATKHLFAEQLPIAKKPDFIRLVMANMDPLLMAYSDKKINIEQYSQQRQKMAQQQQQIQMQLSQEQLKSERIFADAEKQKSNAIQYNEETKRVKAFGDLQNNSNKLQVELVKFGGEQQFKNAEHLLRIDQHNLDLMKQVSDQYNEVVAQQAAQQSQPQQPQQQNQQQNV